MPSEPSITARIARQRRFFSDTVGTALNSIWANRQRALLTALGVITGCMAFTGSYGILWGKFEDDLAELRRLGSTYVSISSQHGLRAEHGTELVDQIPELAVFSPVYAAKATIRTRLSDVDVDVVGVASSLKKIFDLHTSDGRFFTEPEVRNASDVCVIGSNVARRLKLRARGKRAAPTVRLFGQPFRVIGVMEARRGAMPGCGEYDNCVILPSTTLRELLPSAPLAFLAFQARTEKAVPPAVSAIRYRLRRLLGLGSFDRDTFDVHQAADVIARIEKEINTGGAIIMGIVCLTLLVGGIGVMNIMLVTVVERTPEIGLRKAVGARGKEILMQFLVESVCLCTGGGILGTLLGVILSYVLIDLIAPGVTPVLPTALIVGSIGFALGTGLLFGFAPAVKAARLNPIEALRRD